METTFAGKTVTKVWNEYEDFNVGDIVKLKSGGPNMTVDNASSSRIICTWFEGLILHTAEFDQGALEKVTAKDPDLSPA
jgi:uncharacterized protein YodC (DUF2158 family)